MVQHNLLAASRIYNNISFEQMGALLQIPSKKAEKICADMIMTNRLAASIDQIQGVVTFEAARATLPLVRLPTHSCLCVAVDGVGMQHAHCFRGTCGVRCDTVGHPDREHVPHGRSRHLLAAALEPGPGPGSLKPDALSRFPLTRSRSLLGGVWVVGVSRWCLLLCELLCVLPRSVVVWVPCPNRIEQINKQNPNQHPRAQAAHDPFLYSFSLFLFQCNIKAVCRGG